MFHKLPSQRPFSGFGESARFHSALCVRTRPTRAAQPASAHRRHQWSVCKRQCGHRRATGAQNPHIMLHGRRERRSHGFPRQSRLFLRIGEAHGRQSEGSDLHLRTHERLRPPASKRAGVSPADCALCIEQSELRLPTGLPPSAAAVRIAAGDAPARQLRAILRVVLPSAVRGRPLCTLSSLCSPCRRIDGLRQGLCGLLGRGRREWRAESLNGATAQAAALQQRRESSLQHRNRR